MQDLWVMDSFAFALSEGIWSRQSNANAILRNIKTKDYASRTEIVIKQPLVSLVNFLYDKNGIVLFVPVLWPKHRYKIFNGTKISTTNFPVLNLSLLIFLNLDVFECRSAAAKTRP